jgi:hypothetical protein
MSGSSHNSITGAEIQVKPGETGYTYPDDSYKTLTMTATGEIN